MGVSLPDIPSGALYGDTLKCTVTTEMSQRPRKAVTLPVTPRPAFSPQRPVRELELNNGALSVLPYGSRRLNMVLPGNRYPAWVYQILEEIIAENAKVHVYGMESGRVMAAMPLRWKAGGDPNTGVVSASISTGTVYAVQYDPGVGVALRQLTDEDDTLAFLANAPAVDEFAPYPFDMGAFLYKGDTNLVENPNFNDETTSQPSSWTKVNAPTAETNYGVAPESFLHPDLQSLYLAKPSSSATDYYWKSDSFAVTGSSNVAVFVGWQAFNGARGKVELVYDTSDTWEEVIPASTGSGVVMESSPVPAGASSAELRLHLLSNTGELHFSAPQVLDERRHTHVVGVDVDGHANAAWGGSSVYYDLPSAFNAFHGDLAVAFAYVQPGWSAGVCTSETVLCFTAADHGSSSLELQIGGGIGSAEMRLRVDGSTVATDSLSVHSKGDSWLFMLAMDETKTYAYGVNLNDTGTTYSAEDTTLPTAALDRLYVGSDDTPEDQLDGIVGNVAVLSHEDDDGTIAQMITYLTSTHMIDIARNFLGRSYYLDHNLEPHIAEQIYRGSIILRETEKY